jgi:hypothetical protein
MGSCASVHGTSRLIEVTHRKAAARERHWPRVLSIPRPAARCDWFPALPETHAAVSDCSRSICASLTHDNRNVGVPSSDDADATEVSGMKLARRRVVRVHAQQDGPPRQADDEDTGRRETSRLVSVRERREE